MTAQTITPEQKKALEKKERAKNGVDFVRKDLRPGIYSNENIKHKFQIRDRQHFVTTDESQIEILDKDPEIVVFNPGIPNKK